MQLFRRHLCALEDDLPPLEPVFWRPELKLSADVQRDMASVTLVKMERRTSGWYATRAMC